MLKKLTAAAISASIAMMTLPQAIAEEAVNPMLGSYRAPQITSEVEHTVSLARISNETVLTEYDKEKTAEIILAAMKSGATEADVEDLGITVRADENGIYDYNGLDLVIYGLLTEHPEVFHIQSFGLSYRTSGDGIGHITKVVFYNYADADEAGDIPTVIEELESKAESIAKEIIPEDADGMTAALLIHDYLVKTCSYGSEELQEENATGNISIIHSAYAALIDNNPVCEGYSKAFNLIWQKAGFESTEYATSASMQHLWNVVPIDGHWYHMDVTFGDPINADGTDAGVCSHDYFLFGEETINTDDKYSNRSDWTMYDGTERVECASDIYEDEGWAFKKSEEIVFEHGNIQYKTTSGTHGEFSYEEPKYRRDMTVNVNLNGEPIAVEGTTYYDDLWTGEDAKPTAPPTAIPTAAPTAEPEETPIATSTPTIAPTETPAVTATPTPAVTATPTPAVTATPTPAVTPTPTPVVTPTPTAEPTPQPEYVVSEELSIHDESGHNTGEEVTIDNVGTAALTVSNSSGETLFTDVYLAYYREDGTLAGVFKPESITSVPADGKHYIVPINCSDAEAPDDAAYVKVYLWKVDVVTNGNVIESISRTFEPVCDAKTLTR